MGTGFGKMTPPRDCGKDVCAVASYLVPGMFFTAAIYAVQCTRYSSTVPFSSEDPDTVGGLVCLQEDGVEGHTEVLIAMRMKGSVGHAVRQGIVSNAVEGRANMAAVIVAIFKAAEFTLSQEKKTGTMQLQTPHQAPRTSPLTIEAAGQG